LLDLTCELSQTERQANMHSLCHSDIIACSYVCIEPLMINSSDFLRDHLWELDWCINSLSGHFISSICWFFEPMLCCMTMALRKYPLIMIFWRNRFCVHLTFESGLCRSPFCLHMVFLYILTVFCFIQFLWRWNL
jgi:hypothetical protein